MTTALIDEQNQCNDWLKNKAREIILSPKTVSKECLQNSLNGPLFLVNSLNYLEITNFDILTKIDSRISKLSNLTNLVLEGNKLKSIPDELGNLSKLKYLNISRNEIDSLPDLLFEKLTCLQTLNVEQNKLKTLPNMSKLSCLISLKCGSNELSHFPSSLCEKIRESVHSPVPIFEGGTVHLSELNASHNEIRFLPSIIERLVALKSLDLSFNQIETVPAQLANCGKLKELNLKNNPIKDRRLYKMIDQCAPKKVLDYLRTNLSTRNNKEIKAEDEELTNFRKKTDDQDKFTIRLQFNSEDKFVVLVSKLIAEQRKIVACIIHQMDLSNGKILKKFLAIQTKLHQGICDNRQKATIATHDYNKLIPLTSYASKTASSNTQVQVPQCRMVYFEGRLPTSIRLVPLGRTEQMTALELYRTLNNEADQYRKEKKRSTISGIHKYIHLLKGKQLYPVLLDYQQNVLSLPPLTNAEYSKINSNTTSVFVEVSGESVPTCRMVMDELINSIVSASVIEDDGSLLKMFPDDQMLIEPVLVEMADTRQLLSKYPSRIDLQFDHIRVIND